MCNVKLLWPLCAIMLICSCKKESVESFNEHQDSALLKESYTIPVDVALESLYTFIQEKEGQTTKADIPIIGSIETIKRTNLPTKSFPSDTDCNEIVYLINFTEDNGYAILAADSRISEDIISVVDEGNLSSDELLLDYSCCNRIVDDNYPREGSGIIYDENYPDDSFINPNTFSLYSEVDDDYYVGNYLSDNRIIESPSPGSIVNKMSLQYAIDEIEKYDQRTPYINDESSGNENTTSFIISKKTNITSYVSPLLTAEKNWSQDTPFNDFCPIVRRYLFFGQTKRGDAGCVPLAISKILAHFEWPTGLSYNGIFVNWKELKTNYNSAIGKQSAAALLRIVGLECNSLYFFGGTFTFPSNAKSFLRDVLFHNVNYVDYSTSAVISMLDEGCPVFICSIPHKGFLNYDLGNSHGWNIDGYKVKQTTTTKQIYVNGVYSHTVTYTSSPTTMVHCDFGWQGSCNGYYASGIFKLNNPDVEFDNPHDSGSDINYNFYLKIITYNHPN